MATAEKTKVRNFIDGELADAADGATDEVVNPATGEVFAEAPLSTAEDVDRAVQAARRAFDGWARTTPADRAAALFALADIVEENADLLSDLEATDAGKSAGFPLLFTTEPEE